MHADVLLALGGSDRLDHAAGALRHAETLIAETGAQRIAQELHRRTGTLWPEARLFRYRTKHGAEVDFVVEVGRNLWGIEVKSARRISTDMRSGLASLADRTKRLTRKIVVCMTDRRARLGDAELPG